jgi:hypothetical protein
MNSKEKTIIQKLVKIAKKQQDILQKLAQGLDPNVEYLRKAAQVAAMNVGFAATSIDVKHDKGGGLGSTPGSSSLVVAAPNYSVFVKGAPRDNKIRQKYIDTLKAQVQSQKPDLGATLSITFTD